MARLCFDNFVQFGVRLHRAVLIGQNVTVEIVEEGETPANVARGQLVGVGEDIGGDAAPPQLRMERHHRLDRHKNVTKKPAELLQVAAKS